MIAEQQTVVTSGQTAGTLGALVNDPALGVKWRVVLSADENPNYLAFWQVVPSLDECRTVPTAL
jgi:hypothetical protein